ncbi:MAG: hypothetical protein FJ271_07690 [Planctomycetes bacterium]|nr:hypothetical protein [Planctomycetota bacterium]
MQFDVASMAPATPIVASDSSSLTLEMLRQLLEVQRQQLAHSQAVAKAHDPMTRWRILAARWQQDFPDLLDNCREALPQLERAYASLIAALVDELRQNGDDAVENDYALQDLLDRYGMKLGQLGNILSLVGPLAEAGSSNEAAQ